MPNLIRFLCPAEDGVSCCSAPRAIEAVRLAAAEKKDRRFNINCFRFWFEVQLQVLHSTSKRASLVIKGVSLPRRSADIPVRSNIGMTEGPQQTRRTLDLFGVAADRNVRAPPAKPAKRTLTALV